MNLWKGLAAGAAGTTALNAATYLDMALRGRPASTVPEDAVETAHLPIPGDAEARKNRVTGLGALLGIATGTGLAAALSATRALGLRTPLPVTALLAGFGAMVSTDGAMTVAGLTDPREWTVQDWLSDVLPHLAYGAATAAVLHALE